MTNDQCPLTNDLKSRCSSVVEHFLGKEEVDSSILFNGSEMPKVWLKKDCDVIPVFVPGKGEKTFHPVDFEILNCNIQYADA